MPSRSRQDEPSRAFRRALTARMPTQPARAHDRTLLSTITWNAALAPLHAHTTLPTRPCTHRCLSAVGRLPCRQPPTYARAPMRHRWLVRRVAVAFHLRLDLLYLVLILATCHNRLVAPPWTGNTRVPCPSIRPSHSGPSRASPRRRHGTRTYARQTAHAGLGRCTHAPARPLAYSRTTPPWALSRTHAHGPARNQAVQDLPFPPCLAMYTSRPL